MNQNQAKRELKKCKEILEMSKLKDIERYCIKQYQISILNEFEDSGLCNEVWNVLKQ